MVKGVGPVPCDTMIIGEGPGYWEDKKGLPFVGKAGDLLNFHLFKNGLPRDEVYVTNLVKYRCTTADGKDRVPTQEEIERDQDLLLEELERVSPDTILTVGRTSTRYFLGDVDMEAVHGIPLRSPRWLTRTFIPCYHTAAALWDASGEMAAYVADDFRQAGLYLKGLLPARSLSDKFARPDYTLVRGAAATFKDGQDRATAGAVFVDTEGTPGHPWCLTYSTRPGTGRMIRATDKEGLRVFLAWVKKHRLVVVMHNALYDLRILADMGIDLVAEGIPFEDTMLAAYLLRLEPQGLKPLAFRYAGMKMRSYDEVTDPYDRKLMIEWLERAALREYPDPDPIMEIDSKTGKPKVKQPQNAARRIHAILHDVGTGKAKKNGDLIHPRARWQQVDPGLRQQVESEMGPPPEFTFDCMPLQDALDYACRDADATARVMNPLWSKLGAMELKQVYHMKRAILPQVERMMRKGVLIDPQHFRDMRADIAAEQERLLREIKKCAGVKWLNPESSQQVADLLFNKLRLQSDRLTKKGRKPSTDDKALEALVGQHPVIQHILDWREAGTIDGFARDLPSQAGDDHRIRCTLRITRVASGRLAASSPNLLGIPVRSDLGKRLRGGFVAPEGCHLGSADLSQIEMMVMADESGDPLLIKRIREGVDLHSKTAEDILGCSAADSKDPKYREPAKRIGFGVITGITEVGLHQQLLLNHIFGYSVADCAQMIDDWFKLYKGVRRYIGDCRAEARRFGYVKDRWGMVRYLPGVWSDIPYVRAEAERQTHSHKISSGAQGIIQRAQARIWQRQLDEIWPAGIHCEILLQIHDELIWEGEGEPGSWSSDLLSEIIREELVRDTDLFKVPLKAKATVGRTWGELK